MYTVQPSQCTQLPAFFGHKRTKLSKNLTSQKEMTENEMNDLTVDKWCNHLPPKRGEQDKDNFWFKFGHREGIVRTRTNNFTTVPFRLFSIKAKAIIQFYNASIVSKKYDNKMPMCTYLVSVNP